MLLRVPATHRVNSVIGATGSRRRLSPQHGRAAPVSCHWMGSSCPSWLHGSSFSLEIPRKRAQWPLSSPMAHGKEKLPPGRGSTGVPVLGTPGRGAWDSSWFCFPALGSGWIYPRWGYWCPRGSRGSKVMQGEGRAHLLRSSEHASGAADAASDPVLVGSGRRQS